MFPIVDKPSIQYIVEEAIASGIQQIIFVNSNGKQAIEDHFDTHIELETILRSRKTKSLLNELKKLSQMADIITVRQKKPLGLGHAILCAKEIVGNEPFAILLGDDLIDAKKPVLMQLTTIYQKERSPVIALMKIPDSQTHLYGIVKATCRPDNPMLYDISSCVEKPAPGRAPSNLAIIGRYIVTPDIFEYLESTPTGKGRELQLTDALQRMLEQKSILGYRYEGKRLDVGDKFGFLCANIYFGLKRPEFRDSLTTWIKELNIW